MAGGPSWRRTSAAGGVHGRRGGGLRVYGLKGGAHAAAPTMANPPGSTICWPSGILNQGVMNVVTAGVVLNPATILGEIDSLTSRGIEVGSNFMLSDRAHVVCPWHLVEDRLLNESPAGEESIGTTLRGIGPCYRDKVGRTMAIRLGDMIRVAVARVDVERRELDFRLVARGAPTGPKRRPSSKDNARRPSKKSGKHTEEGKRKKRRKM